MTQPISLKTFCGCDFSADLLNVQPALGKLKEYCSGQGMKTEVWQQIEIATAEGLNNAILHGCKNRPEASVHVRWDWSDERLWIEITDPSDFMPGPAAAVLPDDPLAESGRGAFLISTLMDRVEHRKTAEGHTLRMEKEVGRQAWTIAKAAEMESTIEGLMKELSRSYEEISSLFHFAEELATSTTLEEFLNRSFTPLLGLTNGESAFARFLNPDGTDLVLVKQGGINDSRSELIPVESDSAEAVVFRMGKAMTIEDCSTLDWHDELRPHQGGIFICPVSFRSKMIGCLVVTQRKGVPYFSAGELELIRVVADFLGIVTTTNRLQTQRQAQKVAVHDLEIAASIQQSLLPRRFPENSNYRIFGICQNARQVGGDYFDVLQVSPDAILFVIADVMGKGVPAALLASVLRTAIHARLDLATNPGRLLTEVNHQIASDLSQIDMFITAQIACLSEKENTLLLSNAGHCPLLHYNPASESISRRIVEGTPLGVIDNFDYQEQSYQVEKDDYLVFLTDGLYEVENQAGELLGLDNLVHQIQSTRSRNPADFCARLLEYVHKYSGGQPAADDRTLLAIERAL